MITFAKPLIPAGEKIYCPRCKKWLYTLMANLFSGTKIKAEFFNPQANVMPLSKGSLAICPWCVRSKDLIPITEITWMFNGALFTQDGWKPYFPHPSKGAQTEAARSLSKKKTFI